MKSDRVCEHCLWRLRIILAKKDRRIINQTFDEFD